MNQKKRIHNDHTVVINGKSGYDNYYFGIIYFWETLEVNPSIPLYLTVVTSPPPVHLTYQNDCGLSLTIITVAKTYIIRNKCIDLFSNLNVISLP